MHGYCGETTVSHVVDQLSTIFTYVEIKWIKLLEFENDKSPDLHAGWHNKSYDQLGVLADIWETVQKHMTKYNIQMRKNYKGCGTRLTFEREK